MQRTRDEEMIMTKLGCMKNTSNILSAFINAGYYKPEGLDEAFAEFERRWKKLYQEIISDAQKQAQEQREDSGYNLPWSELPVTEGQRRAIYAITKDNPDLLAKLPGNDENEDFNDIINKMSKQDASDYIEKYGEKK
jgi:hypothetical protein